MNKNLKLLAEHPELSPYAVVREELLPLFDGLGTTQRNEKIKTGEYPRPIRVGVRAKAWILQEIINWQEARKRARDRNDDDTAGQ